MLMFEDRDNDEVILNPSTVNCVVDNGVMRQIRTSRGGYIVTKESLEDLESKLNDLGFKTFMFNEYRDEKYLIVEKNLYYIKNKKIHFLREQ